MGIANMTASFIYIIDSKSEVTNLVRKFRYPRNWNVHSFFFT